VEVLLGPLPGEIEGASPSEGDAAFVAHGDPEKDYLSVKLLLERGLWYVGLLGSRRKGAVFVRRLLEEGVDPSRVRESLRVPAGLDLGADGPEEVALSVAAEILALSRGASCRPLSSAGSPPG